MSLIWAACMAARLIPASWQAGWWQGQRAPRHRQHWRKWGAGEPAASSTSPVQPALAAAGDVEVGEGGDGEEGEGAGGERVNGSCSRPLRGETAVKGI